MPKNGEREGRSAVMCVIRNGEKCAGVEIAETSTREAELMTELGNAAYRRGKQKESLRTRIRMVPFAIEWKRNRMEEEDNNGAREVKPGTDTVSRKCFMRLLWIEWSDLVGRVGVVVLVSTCASRQGS
jgi:hypothetical protein